MEQPSFPKSVKVESKPAKFCPGCGYGIILRNLGWLIDKMNIQAESVFMTDIGCNLLAWDYFNLPSCQTHHGRTVPTATGFKMADPGKYVICLVGDGGGYAIGLQNLIHACLRNSPITVILVNNTNYGMTGGQASPTTIEEQITDSTPFGKESKLQGGTFFGPELLRAIANPKAYIARTSNLKPQQITNFLEKSLLTQKEGNFSFVEIVSACPQNWKTNAQDTLDRVKKLETIFKQGEF